MVVMTTSEARKDLAKVVQQVREGEKVIINRHNKPVAAIIAIGEFRRFRAWEKQRSQDGADSVDRLEKLKAEISEVSQDIADAEAALSEEGRISLEDLMAELA